MRINHNIAALNTYRQLNSASSAQSKSMEKLSSGLRINKAGDDAAGLAISEKMRGQIRGLDQAAANGQDGISLIQTAEGALNETHSILQRMRELAVQSSNGSQTDDDRKAIQDEITQLKTEVDRISTSTEFNTKKLLNGDLSKDGALKVGGNVVGLATVVGGTEEVTATALTVSGGTADSGSGAVSVASASGSETSALNDVKFNFKLGADTQDPTAYYDAEKKELVVTLSADQTKNTNTSLQTAIGTAIKGSDLVETKDGGTTYSYKSTGDTFDATGAGFTFTGFDGLTTATDDIIKQSQVDELNSSLTYQSGAAAVTAQEGFAEKFQIGDKVGDTLSIAFTQMQNAAGETVNDALNGYTFKFVAGNQSYIQAAVDDNDKTITVSFSSVKALNTDDNIANALKGLNVNGVSLDGTNMAFTVTGTGSLLDGTGKGFDASKFANQGSVSNDGVTFQIGANNSAEQRVKLNIEDMSTKGLNIDGISAATQKGATDAITSLDKAINSVSSQRSSLGAVQNRLEHTINNLSTSSENLTAAESRIRDVDMAKQMMDQTKNSILSQAAQAMLAQANQQPQGVLQLLR
ncbi:flagellin [Lysinibacillus fusiformis]|nr:flagellin [Lysinibacillus fusiformis]